MPIKVVSLASLVASVAADASPSWFSSSWRPTTGFNQALCEASCGSFRVTAPGGRTCMLNCAKSCDKGFNMDVCKAPCKLPRVGSSVRFPPSKVGGSYSSFYTVPDRASCENNCDKALLTCSPTMHPTSSPTSTYASLLVSARSASAATAFDKHKCDFSCHQAFNGESHRGPTPETGYCMQNCAKSCDEGFDMDFCKYPCNKMMQGGDMHSRTYQMHMAYECMKNCDAKAKTCSASSSECDAKLVTANEKLAKATECKANLPNYKPHVNDPECNPKNCDEWSCGTWCKCYNTDDDATYESLGCAAEDEAMCQC